MRFNKGTYLMIIMLFACSAGMTQVFSALTFSPIASSSSLFTANSNPIMMDGKGKCLVTSSGLSVLSIAKNGKGAFGAGCVEKPPVATITVSTVSVSLNVYPNPTSGQTTLKCEGQFDANLSCQIRVTGMDGRVMMSQVVPMKDVQAGYLINVGAYAAGNYVVSLDFMNQRYAMKLIKL